MPTPGERITKSISRKRHRSGILVPMLEDLLAKPVNIETKADVAFLTRLNQLQVERELERRKEVKVFSPSALSSCLRRVFFIRHGEQMGIPFNPIQRVEPHYYFLTGNFTHAKWQFAMFKLEQRIDNPDVFKLIDVERRIMSKRGDHGGTLDVLCAVNREPLIVDYKGVNVRSFAEAARGTFDLGYGIQLADYMMLYNSSKNRPTDRITRSLLIHENKGGPDGKHPIALHETEIRLKDFLPEVKARLGILRGHEEENSIPEPECTSTSSYQFQGCPFRKFCKKEIEAAAKRRKSDAGETEWRVAKPAAKKRR